MKDFTRRQLESARPRGDSVKLLDFCLTQIFRDKKHGTDDLVVKDLTFEELIGALLLARARIMAMKSNYEGSE